MNQAHYTLAALQASFSGRFDGRKDRGATAVEYGLIVGLIAVVIIAAVLLLGDNLNAMFTGVNEEIADKVPADTTP